MSLLGDAFDNTIALNVSLVVPFKEVEPVRLIIDEPTYVDSTTQSGISASKINKRVNNLRITQENVTESPTSTPEETTEMLPFLARITGNTSRGENKWLYLWEAVVPGEGSQFIEGSYANLLNTDGQEAVNTMEDANTATCVAPGVCLDCDYPDEWSPQPIGGQTCSVQPIVVMHQMTVAGAAPTYVFQAENSHDGTCPDGADIGISP